ncbi:cell division protein FtsZ [Parasulfuritortus cantonensis]|uniref:Cell division protein FtsZ n=1 Tax=Parasulfuritortus cantonensis TaxID=2528202 RepID=A0A4R1BJ93_9PROT|nr:cell division protein FtsZ [Parasulfuritortus cantonensis]TCJ17248.1 cell division protein FtsZ [Parasulfuritortus cantonensis]
MFELEEMDVQDAVIKVIGVGGCGGNAVDHMINKGMTGVEFLAVNTDAQALRRNQAPMQLQIGTNVTKGLGAGARPEIGREAALEDRERIAELIDGADMLFITAGMGGGTGTGAAPVVAEVAKELGILTVAVVTKPFAFEGKRMRVADHGLKALSEHVDSLIIIPNDKLRAVLGGGVKLNQAFEAANDVLHSAVGGIAEIISNPGMINVDFADVRTVMSEVGMAMMGTAQAEGEGRARVAAEAAVKSPLLENVDLRGARGVVVNITSDESLTMDEFYEVMNTIQGFTAEEATVIVGTAMDPAMGDILRVTMVATGLGNPLVSKASKPQVVVDNVQATGTYGMAGGSRAETADPDYEIPTAMRMNPNRGRATAAIDAALQQGIETLDIPAFLRRQAD